MTKAGEGSSSTLGRLLNKPGRLLEEEEGEEVQGMGGRRRRDVRWSLLCLHRCLGERRDLRRHHLVGRRRRRRRLGRWREDRHLPEG